MNIIVKYCGGCNCQIDRSAAVKKIENSLGADCQFTTATDGGPFDAGILVCGCPSACARKPELTDLTGNWVVIAGKTVDTRELPEEDIPAAVVRKIK